MLLTMEQTLANYTTLQHLRQALLPPQRQVHPSSQILLAQDDILRAAIYPRSSLKQQLDLTNSKFVNSSVRRRQHVPDSSDLVAADKADNGKTNGKRGK